MLFIGIDPGTATTGWGVVKFHKSEEYKKEKIVNGKIVRAKKKNISLVDFGCILTDKDEEMPKRLLEIRRELNKVLRKFKPDGLVVERLFFGVNSRTAMAVGQARGVIMLTAAENKVPFFEYTGLEVKLEVANHGRSDKKDVQKAVRRLLGVTNIKKPRDQKGRTVNRFRDDAYDAVAVAICHLSKMKLLV